MSKSNTYASDERLRKHVDAVLADPKSGFVQGCRLCAEALEQGLWRVE